MANRFGEACYRARWSLLLKLMMGLMRPSHGRVVLFGRDLNALCGRVPELDVASIVISHDMASTFRIADRIAMLHAEVGGQRLLPMSSCTWFALRFRGCPDSGLWRNRAHDDWLFLVKLVADA